ncbi:phage portal protein (plasmid) [Pseudorhodobacter turbinis]|uniref:Phage portal protein n=1 Tax=Pseudorhodobacter turbinis TaxID=2500533 RepID=A0A4P8EIV4_9RHOB|nr:phage portal protein [Pseudorhodobacter turbinis]QCO56625.1 phage portal protein [Pseudorhodobacter turbinis]
MSSASAKGAIHGGAATVSTRAAHYVLNNPHGSKIAQTLPDQLIGHGIKPIAQVENERLRRNLHRAFEAWTDNADASGLCDFYAMQHQAARDVIVMGEALLIWSMAPDGMPQLKRLHPEQLDRSFTKTLSATNYAVQGVEFDRTTGARVAYHIRSETGHCTSGYMAGDRGLFLSQRLPAASVIHMVRPLVPGQVRGLSWFAPILLTAHELDQLADALLVRAKVAALHAGFIYDAEGTGGGYSGTSDGDSLNVSLEPGTMSVMPPNKRVEFSAPPDSGDGPALAVHTLRSMAAGVNLTYEQLTGDYSQVTYSSLRASLLEFRRFCEAVQHHTIVFQLCRPVWSAFMRWQVMLGNVSATDFMNPATGLQTAKWLPPSWPWVDPQKDANAAIMEMDANLRSRADIIAERGYDVDEIDRQIAADKRHAERLNLNPDKPKDTPDAP